MTPGSIMRKCYVTQLKSIYIHITHVYYLANVHIHQNKTGLEKLKFMYKFMDDEV